MVVESGRGAVIHNEKGCVDGVKLGESPRIMCSESVPENGHAVATAGYADLKSGGSAISRTQVVRHFGG